MPINLRYGQQAVARGFLTPQRLQTVLAKQQQLESQGKKVSVRMILEKSKLLSDDQLTQIDRDLNIKVVKKRTGKLDRPGVDARRQQRPATGPVGAQNFAGDAVPQFSGMSGGDPDATVFSPPPPEMQSKIRNERERSKAEQKRKQDQEAASFFGDDNASPFGGDPFGGDAMSPEPMPMQPMGGFGDEMQPEPFGNEMQPEPFGGGFNEMQPEPMHGGFGGDDLQPQGDGFGDEAPFSADPFGAEPEELSRMDSSPKLSSLPVEFDGFGSPEDEELPTIGAGFDEEPAPPPRRQPAPQAKPQRPQQPAYAAPMNDLSPAGDGFDDFGNDIRSPEELDAAPSPGARGGGNIDATMFSPPPPGMGSPRQKTGAMEKTMFSPPPPGFHPRDRQAAPEPEPEPEPMGDAWGEPAMDEPAGFEDAVAGADMDATVFSPPPPEYEERRRETERKQVSARGRQGADDFGEVDIPVGKRMDDVPTSPSQGDDVHPLRRGVGTSSSSGVNRTTSKRRPAQRSPSSQVPVSVPDDVADELPSDDIGADIPDDVAEPAGVPGGKGAGKFPPKAPKEDKKEKKHTGKRDLPRDKVTVPDADGEAGGKKKKSKTSSRVILLFLLLLVIVLGLLITPIAYPTHGIEQLDQLRNHRSAAPIYDYVQDIYDTITGQPPRRKPGTVPQDPIILPGNGPADNAPADNSPAENSGG